MTENKTVAVLVRAREFVAYSWAQGHFGGRDSGGPREQICCVYLALRRADSGRTGREAELVFKRAVGCESVIAWNDDVDRTYEQVLEGFSRAIELARAESAGAA